MNQEPHNKINKVISIPFYVPVIIITFCIILFINLNNSNVKATAGLNEEKLEKNYQNEVETMETKQADEEILPAPSEAVEQNAEITTDNTVEKKEAKTATYTINGKQYTVVGSLNIPSLGIEYPILSETSPQLLKVSVTKYWGANPNEVGNMVVTGHNYKNSKFFGKLPNIKKDAIIKITDLTGKTLDYKVYDTYVIDPNDNTCTSQLTDGKTEVTLITCYYENGSAHATKRFVVKARANI